MDRPFIFSRAVPAEMEELPGVWKNKNSSGYRIPMNAQSVLGYNSPDPIVEAHVVDRALSGPLMRGDLSDFAKPHQKRMLSKALALSGSHSWAPPGAGKTLVGLTFAAACSGPRLIITKAAARGTWVEQCERYTHLEPTLLLGQTAPTIPPSSTVLWCGMRFIGCADQSIQGPSSSLMGLSDSRD